MFLCARKEQEDTKEGKYKTMLEKISQEAIQFIQPKWKKITCIPK